MPSESDLMGSLDKLAKQINDLPNNLAARIHVTDEILEILAVYEEQDASPSGVDTPGALEHMGDVWRMFARWGRILNAK